MRYVLFNEKSNNGRAKETLEVLKAKLNDPAATYLNVIGLDVKQLVSKLNADDEIILVGGDGTLHHFVNDLDDKIPANNIYFYSAGSGNDFVRDVVEGSEGKCEDLLLINKYLVNLPWVILEGKKYYFLNNVGFGIDGYCCEVADKMRAKGKSEKINYTSIAIKGLLGGYHPTKAEVEVDGQKMEFKHVFLAPTMNGRFVGGGMMLAPHQDRLNEERKVSFVIFKSGFRLNALMNFPKVFTGEHLKKEKLAKEYFGKHVKVKFNRPTAIQLDGETFLNQLEYEVFTPEK